MNKKFDKEDNTKLLKLFLTLNKTLSEVEEIINKYKFAGLHLPLAKIYNAMGDFSGTMMEISHGND